MVKRLQGAPLSRGLHVQSLIVPVRHHHGTPALMCDRFAVEFFVFIRPDVGRHLTGWQHSLPQE